jgi:hypothetical protein
MVTGNKAMLVVQKMQMLNHLVFSAVFTVHHLLRFVMALWLSCHSFLTLYIYMTYFSFCKTIISGDYISNISVQHLETRTFPVSRQTSATKFSFHFNWCCWWNTNSLFQLQEMHLMVVLYKMCHINIHTKNKWVKCDSKARTSHASQSSTNVEL